MAAPNPVVTLLLALAGATGPTARLVVNTEGAVLVYPGVNVEVPISMTVAPGVHVQANPASRPELIPLSVVVTDSAGLKVRAPLYPVGRPHKIDIIAEPISIYENDLQVGLPIEVAPGVTAGKHVFRGQVRFQSCDDKKCHAPASIPFAIDVEVGPRPAQRGAR